MNPSFDVIAAKLLAEDFADLSVLEGLEKGQRAMIAARMPLIPRGFNSKTIKTKAYSLRTLSKKFGIHHDLVYLARRALQKATPVELAAIESGKVGLHKIARGTPPPIPSASRAQDARVTRAKLSSDLWGRVRTALDNVTSLPNPRDVAQLIRKAGGNQPSVTVAAKLQPAIEWLTRFAHEWDAFESREDRYNGRHARTGSGATGAQST